MTEKNNNDLTNPSQITTSTVIKDPINKAIALQSLANRIQQNGGAFEYKEEKIVKANGDTRNLQTLTYWKDCRNCSR